MPSNEGFKIPFLYFGTKGAKFGPHSEEDRLCSINYLHLIESTYPKVWYSVAREDKLKVEFFLQNYAPEMFEHCQNAMEHRYHFLDPQLLLDAGIQVRETIQRPGELVLTWEGTLHWGLNMGPNCAVVKHYRHISYIHQHYNFIYFQARAWATEEWIKRTMFSRQCNCSIPVVSFHEYLHDHFKEAFLSKEQYFQWLWTEKYEFSGRRKHVPERNILYPGRFLEDKFTEKGQVRRFVNDMVQDLVTAAISKFTHSQYTKDSFSLPFPSSGDSKDHEKNVTIDSSDEDKPLKIVRKVLKLKKETEPDFAEPNSPNRTRKRRRSIEHSEFTHSKRPRRNAAVKAEITEEVPDLSDTEYDAILKRSEKTKHNWFKQRKQGTRTPTSYFFHYVQHYYSLYLQQLRYQVLAG